MSKPVKLNLYYLINNDEEFEVHCDNFDLDEAIEKTPNGVAKMQKELKSNWYLPELGQRIKDAFNIFNMESKIEITNVSITSYTSCDIELQIESSLSESKVKTLVENIVNNDTFSIFVDFINPDDGEMDQLEFSYKFYKFR